MDVSSLTFTPENWETPQTVTVTGTNDFVVDGDVEYNISLVASSEDEEYAELKETAIATNNDVARVNLVIPSLELKVLEGYGSDVYKVVLNSKPNADVTITIAADEQINQKLGNETVRELVFTPNNWNAFQNDFLSGGEGDDNINGGSGNDVVYASSGQDRIFGGEGDDMLFGESDNDYIQGDAGADTLTGGDGKDAFAIDTQTGVTSLEKLNEVDFITDFDPAEDRIDLDF